MELTTEQLHNIVRLLSSDEPANIELGKQLLKGANRFDCETIEECCDYEGCPKRYTSPLILDSEIWKLFRGQIVLEVKAAESEFLQVIEESQTLIAECKELRKQSRGIRKAITHRITPF